MIELNKDLRSYYAHSMKIYDTNRERNELKVLNGFFNNVICPNNDIGNAQRRMRAYIKIVGWADIVIVSEYKKHIGSGAYSEVMHALSKNIPVMCLRDGKLYRVVAATIVDRRDPEVKFAKLTVEG